MEIKSATALPSAKPSADSYFDTVARLRALDGVEVEVMRREPGWMILRTPLGKLLTANSLPLRTGERVRLRVAEHAGQPLLKLAPIARQPLAPLALSGTAHPRLLAASADAPGRMLLGIVEKSGARGSSALFSGGRENLPPIQGAVRGDWLLLRSRSANDRMEIFPVEREAVNRALLRRLLPDLQAGPGNNLPRLARLLLGGIDSLSRGGAASTPLPPPKTGSAPATSAATARAANPSPNLQQLFDHLPRLAEIDAPAIRKWFEFLQLARPVAGAGDTADKSSLPAVLRRLLDTNLLGNELRAAVRARSQTQAGGADADAVELRDALTRLARDVARLAEQGLVQNLGGRASASLQQEAQQPFAINLSIPLLERDEVRPLRVELKQRGGGEDDTAQCWDIHLDFEFDGLGAIACHGLLAGQQVSASFYSAEAVTRDRVNAALPGLLEQLQRAGFETGEFHSFDARPATSRETAPQGPPGLVDLRA